MGDAVIKLMVTIVDRGRSSKAVDLFKAAGLPFHYACLGHGTANSDILDYLGLGETQKDVLLTAVPEPAAHGLLVRAAEKLQLSSPGKGIIFTMPLSSVSGVVSKILNRSAAREDWGREQEGTSMAEKGKNDLVVVVVNHGCTDLVMEAAQAAGARGGTVLHARRLGYEEGERSGEGAVRPEKEIVTILVPRSIRQMVMERVSKTAGINTQARGILFSLPVDEIAGLALAEPQAED